MALQISLGVRGAPASPPARHCCSRTRRSARRGARPCPPRPLSSAAAPASASPSSATFHPTGSGTAIFRVGPPSPPASPLRAALAAAGPAGLATMAMANALFYCAAFALAARSLPRPPGGGWGPALAAVGKAWGVAYASGLATKVPRSAVILAAVPLVGRALAVAGGGVPGRAGRLGVAVALACAGCVLLTLGAAAVAWA